MLSAAPRSQMHQSRCGKVISRAANRTGASCDRTQTGTDSRLLLYRLTATPAVYLSLQPHQITPRHSREATQITSSPATVGEFTPSLTGRRTGLKKRCNGNSLLAG